MTNKPDIQEQPDTFSAKKHKREEASLFSILQQEELGFGKFGAVSKIKAKIGSKEKDFALKQFTGASAQNDIVHALNVHSTLKSLKLPTRTTYREIPGEDSILMTLGNKESALIFSPHNKSEDRNFLRIKKISTVRNLNSFYEKAFSTLKKLSHQEINVYHDTYLLKYENENISFLLGDFDLVRLFGGTMLENIENFCLFLAYAGKYLEMKEELFRDFAYYLMRMQKAGDETLKNIDLHEIFDAVGYRCSVSFD